MAMLSRRTFTGLVATWAVGGLAAACGGGAPASPAATSAPASKPAEPAKPAGAEPTKPAAAAPTTAPAAPAPAAAPTAAIVVGKPQAGGVGLIFYTGLTGPDGQIMRDMVTKYNTENGKDAATIEIMPWSDMFAKMVATMTAGNPLDVVLVHPADLIQFVEQDALLPIGDHLAPLGLKLDDYLQPPIKWCTINGKLYGLPMDQHQWNVWVRTDLAEKAGLDAKNPPKDRKTFEEWIQKLTKKEGDKPTVGGLEVGYPNPWSLAWSAIYSNGGAYTTDDWTKCTINSPEAAEAMEWVMSMVDGYSTKSVNIADDFVKGTAAQMHNGPWNNPGLEKSMQGQNYITYVTPTLFKKRVVPASAHNWSLPAQKDQARIDAAAKMVKWMSDNSVTWALSGQIPVKKAVIESAEFKKLQNRQPFVDSIPDTIMWSNVRFYGELESPTGARRKNFELIITKQISIKDGLAKMEKEVNEVLARPK